jgi:hypothetical protein
VVLKQWDSANRKARQNTRWITTEKTHRESVFCLTAARHEARYTRMTRSTTGSNHFEINSLGPRTSTKRDLWSDRDVFQTSSLQRSETHRSYLQPIFHLAIFRFYKWVSERGGAPDWEISLSPRIPTMPEARPDQDTRNNSPKYPNVGRDPDLRIALST